MRNGFATLKISMIFLGLAYAYDAGQGGFRINANASNIEQELRKLGNTGKYLSGTKQRFEDLARHLEIINQG